MKRKNSALLIIRKVFGETIRIVPFSGILGIGNYILQGLLPAALTLVTARLFETPYSDRQGRVLMHQMLLLGGLLAGIYALVYLVEFIASITINAGIYERCTSHYRLLLSEKMSRLSMLDFENAEIFNLNHRARDCVSREIPSQLYMSLTCLITSGVSVVSTIIVLSAYSIWFLPISFLSVIPYFVSRILRGKDFYRLKKAQAVKTRRLNYLWSLFKNPQANREMRVMGFGEYLTEKWADARDEVDHEFWAYIKKDGRSLLLCDSVKTIGYGVCVLFALVLTVNGVISIGLFGACIAAFKAVQEASRSFLIELGNFPEKISFSRDYFDFLDLPEEPDGKKEISGFEEKIVITDIDFSYPGSKKKALENVSLTINKGEKIVVLGLNGSGKTTLSKVILGVYKQESGEVYLDNIPIEEIKKSTLFPIISLVAQNYGCYRLTLRENVAISDLKHLENDKKIIDILRESGFDQPLSWEKELDKQIGREYAGMELSSGQWQKIAIARALFKDSSLVILDEPTSALDPIMESEILQQFIKMSTDKTAVIISHRAGLCKIADRIIVMKEGRICETGTHASLIGAGGEYARLYHAQEQWY